MNQRSHTCSTQRAGAQGSYDNAAEAFQNAVALDPAQGNAALNLALVRVTQAQAALDTALARLAPNSPEHLQADTLQRQIKLLLGAPERGAPSHRYHFTLHI